MSKALNGSFLLPAVSQAVIFVEEWWRKSSCMKGDIGLWKLSSNAKSVQPSLAIRIRTRYSFISTYATTQSLSSVPCVSTACCIKVLYRIIFGTVMAGRTWKASEQGRRLQIHPKRNAYKKILLPQPLRRIPPTDISRADYAVWKGQRTSNQLLGDLIVDKQAYCSYPKDWIENLVTWASLFSSEKKC